MTTKREITNEFNRLKEFGFTVITFNAPASVWQQQSGFVDHIIFNRKYIVFVEVKINKDKLSDKQKVIGEKLSSCAVWNGFVKMKYIKNLEEAKILTKHLLKGDL